MSANPPPEVDVGTAAQMVLAGAVLVDVREAAELAICSIAGSRHIPMGQIPARIDELPAGRPLLIICHHGGRSRSVTQFLRSRGRLDATNVAGGIDAWAAKIDPSLARY